MSPAGVARRGVNGSVALTFDLPPVPLRLHQWRNLAVCDFNRGATWLFAVSMAAHPGCLLFQPRRNLSGDSVGRRGARSIVGFWSARFRPPE